MKNPLTILLLSLLFSSSALAADLRGSFQGLSGATVTVSCGNVTRSAKISSNGKFRISKLPANTACQFSVISGTAASIPIAFNTNKNITQYTGVLRKAGNRVIVIRK